MPEFWPGTVHSKCGRCGRPGQNLIGSPARTNTAPPDADGPKGAQQRSSHPPAPSAGGAQGQQAAEQAEAVQQPAGSGEAAQADAAELLAAAPQSGQVEQQVPPAQSAINGGQQPADTQAQGALPQEHSQGPGHSPGTQATQPQPDHQHETRSGAHYTTEAVLDVHLAAKGAAWHTTDREVCQPPTGQQPEVPR